ncbi:MAG: tetratricopeptide repeat protein [Planctomycetaceae bacterium]|jgi:tetratricopeptide (TPR) repeat protein|nr:tetratricopeptide repeat protein [Planctomycetaceae bacterium]
MPKVLNILFIIFVLLSTQAIAFAQETSDSQANEKQAIDRFWKILVQSPRKGTALDRVYSYYIDEGKWDALHDLAQSPTISEPNNGKSFLLFGLILSRHNEDFDATTALTKAEKLLENDAMPSFYLADVLIAQGQLQEAADALERSLSRKAPQIHLAEILRKLGWIYARLGAYEKSQKIWEKMEKTFPDDPDILIDIAETLENEGKLEESLKKYQRLIDIAKSKNDSHSRARFATTAADIKIQIGKKQEALEDFENLLDNLADESWLAESVRNRIERVFMRQADYHGLIHYYKNRLEKHANDLETRRRLAALLIRLSQNNNAREYLQEGIQKFPSNIPLRLTLIELALSERRFEEAEMLFAEMNRLEPNNTDHLAQWGLAVLANTNRDEKERKHQAAKIWRQIVNMNSHDAVALTTGADLFADNDFPTEAEELYQKAIALRPNDAAMYERLGYFYYRQKNKKKAAETFWRIAEETRRDADALAQIADIFHQLDFIEDAIAALREASGMEPARLDFSIRLIELFLKKRDFGNAEKQIAVAEQSAKSDEQQKTVLQYQIQWLTATNQLVNAAENLAQKISSGELNSPQTLANLYWKLSLYQTTLGEMDAAVQSIQRGLQHNPQSILLLRTAADIASKLQASRLAAPLWEKLAETDAPRRIIYLRELANLYKELGELNKALETAQKMISSGTGNVSHLRFLAEILFATGNRVKGTETLRLALRLDPNDQQTLHLLADALFADGQTDEAAEFIWRIFERSGPIENKFSAVDKLLVFYRQTQQTDRLIERLKSGCFKNRETAYCLARVYTNLSDYQSARKTLETLLTAKNNKTSDDVILLSRLSQIAEMQNDFAGAVYYQEALCDLSEEPTEIDRLISLYYRNRQKEKAALFKKTAFARKTFGQQLGMIDQFLAYEEYGAAAEILDEMERQYPNHWEILVRRLLLEGWTQTPKVIETAIRLRSLDISPETKSTQQNAKQNFQFYQTSGKKNAWRLDDAAIDESPVLLADLQRPESLRIFADQLAAVLFRERLTLDEQYYRNSNLFSVNPPKPTIPLDTFFAAKLVADGWLLKNAVQSRKIENFYEIFADDSYGFKEQYVLSQIGKWLIDDNALPEILQDSSQITLTLGRLGENGWREEAFLVQCSQLTQTFSQKEIPSLVETLTQNLEKPDSALSRKMWNQALSFASFLRKTHHDNEAEEIESLIKKAGNKNYRIDLFQAEHWGKEDFSRFAELISRAKQHCIQQTHDHQEQSRAFREFDRVFAEHLQSKADDFFAEKIPALHKQIRETLPFWIQTFDKVQFGQRTLRGLLNSRKKRFELPDEKNTTEEILNLCKEYETYVYRVLELRLSADYELIHAFEKTNPLKNSGQNWFSMADLKRYLMQNTPKNTNYASYLVNRSLFADNGKRVETFSSLDYASGIFFTMDEFFSRSKHAKEKSFTERLRIFLDEKIPATHQEIKKNIRYIREMTSAAETIRLATSDSPEAETTEAIRQKTNTLLAEIKDSRDSAIGPAYAALTILAIVENNWEDVEMFLEKIPSHSPTDIKAREILFVHLFQKSGRSILKKRNEKAIEQLFGYRLNEDELIDFWNLLKQSERRVEANRIRERLLPIATNPKNQESLLQSLLSSDTEHDPKIQEQLVFLALKVFRDSSVCSSSGIASEELAERLRLTAIQALDRCGKLSEITDTLERQSASIPGAIVLLKQLADVNDQTNHKEKAEQIAGQIAGIISEDSPFIMDYVRLLYRLEKKEEAASWLEKSLLKQPSRLFRDYEQYQKILGRKHLLEILEKLDAKTIVQNSFQIFHQIQKERENPETNEQAKQLFDKLWNITEISDKEQNLLRQTAVRSLHDCEDAFFYPYYQEWIIDVVSPKNRELPINPFQIIYWIDHNPQTYTTSFLILAKKCDKLQEFYGKLQQIIEAYESLKQNKNQPRYFSAKILEAAALFVCDKSEDGIKIIEMLESEKRAEKILADATLTLGLMMDQSPNANVNWAIQNYEKAFEINSHRAYSPFFSMRIALLKLQQENQEQQQAGIEAITKYLRNMLIGLKQCDDKSGTSVDGAYFSRETLANLTEKLGTALVRSGRGDLVVNAYQELVDNQSWFETLKNDHEQKEILQKILAARKLAEQY